MRLIPLLLSAGLVLSAPAALAQTSTGAEVGEVRDWIAGLGGAASEIQRPDGETYFTVTDRGMTWALLFYGCRNDTCGDVQFSAVFPTPGAAEAVNAWNREQRFVKAFQTPAAEGREATVTVQYDVLLTGQGAEQLADPLAVWLELLPQAAQRLGGR